MNDDGWKWRRKRIGNGVLYFQTSTRTKMSFSHVKISYQLIGVKKIDAFGNELF
jgi:aspartate carbamoyltransferase catalytic subunit